MPGQSLAQGLFLAAVALAFGLGALRYPIGTLSRFGPGFFPLVVSGALLLLSIAMLAKSLYARSSPIEFAARNVGIVLLALLGFVAATRLVDMMAGIAVLVFTAGLASPSYAWKRNVLVTVVLVAIALAFERLLGLRLHVL